MFSEFLLVVTGPGKTSYEKNFNCNLDLGVVLNLDLIRLKCLCLISLIASGRWEIIINVNHFNDC